MNVAGVLSHQFRITSRMAAAASTVDSWTCKRAHDFSIGIGVDHRAVHCQLQLRVGQQRDLQRNWQPYLDDNCCATRYQVIFQKLLAKQSNINFESMESCSHIAATSGGSCSRVRARFEPSPTVRDLRLRRRACADSCSYAWVFGCPFHYVHVDLPLAQDPV